MNDDNNSKRAALDRLAQALVDDVLTATDAEILAEAKEDGTDPAATAARLKGIYRNALANAGKARLAAAKAAVGADRRSARPGIITALDPTAARARLEAVLKRDPETLNKLTLAARKGEGLSDADVQGLLDDLEELGILPSEDNKGGDT